MDFTEVNTDIKLNNNSIKTVTHFTYLGSRIFYDGDATLEIKTLRDLASNSSKQLTNVWKSKPLSNKTKLSLFNSGILPVLTYGCESWKFTKVVEEKLNACENKCLRNTIQMHYKYKLERIQVK
jgi:hypothetical protein